MTLTSPPVNVAPFESGRIAAGISASATTITVSPIYKTVNGVRTKQGFNSTSGIAIISQGDYQERISFEGASVDATTKITTLTTCVRGLSVTSTTASFSGGTGRIWAKGANIKIVADASYFQSGVFTNVANTFTDHQTIATTKELRFKDSDQAIYETGDELYFKSSTTAAKSLAQLSAANGSDEKVGVSSNDTTPDYLFNKLAAGTGISITETNDGGNEDVTIAIVDPVTVATGGSGRQSSTAYAVICGGTTGTGEHQSIASVGTANQVLTSNGAGALPTMQDAKVYLKPLFMSAASSATLTNPTSATDYNTHTYTIPANDLVNGVTYHFDFTATVTFGTSSTFALGVELGGTEVLSAPFTATTGSNLTHRISGSIMGTAAAGGSVAVRSSYSANRSGAATAHYTTTNLATNGTLVITFTGLFGTSDGSHTTVGLMSEIWKTSTTAF